MRQPRAAGATRLLLQNVPGVLAAVMVEDAVRACGYEPFTLRVGVVISEPGERLAGVSKTFNVAHPDADYNNALPYIAQDAVLFANQRAKTVVEGNDLIVTVDPVTPFVYKGIEWL